MTRSSCGVLVRRVHEAGRRGALVHCHAGVSRSCAVIAAHVMKTRGVDADDALEVVRRAHPDAHPNAGFVAQLRLWRSMDCKLNMADEAYRLYSVARLARRREHRGYVDATDVQPDPGADVDGTSAQLAAKRESIGSSRLSAPRRSRSSVRGTAADRRPGR